MRKFIAPLALLASPALSATAGDAELEPEVTIIQRDGERVEEYRVNNDVYMIKITPSKGAPYYLLDTDGDGDFDSRRNDLDPDVHIPNWVILRWK
ncbi:MAG TPA: DUF2782 domain-containing protein [Gammaproteobacteria bacterium]|nr:DUF2782 domain-containing protein [Gammaproteobacteria bacterium]